MEMGRLALWQGTGQGWLDGAWAPHPADTMDELITEDEPRSAARAGLGDFLIIPRRFDGAGPPLRILRLAGEVHIGRGKADVSVDAWKVDDVTVSRRHARITAEEDGLYIEDSGSRNGTWVDGWVLRGQKARLGTGSIIVLGGEVAVVRRLAADQISALTAEQEDAMGPVPTTSPALAMALRRLRVLARTDRPVLLAGETGAGKEVYARAVHDLSGRPGPFVAVNCSSFQRELLESHLFGYKRGSHSQASDDSPGILSTAEGGTLFLDEIGEMEPTLQTKLLRFLQDRSFFGVGVIRAKQADVRIIAASQSPQTTLRPDILGRFGADAVFLPPLRERREDLPALCRHFLARLPGPLQIAGFERVVCLAFCRYDWPRNVRQLEATVTEAALSAQESGAARISLTDLPAAISELVSIDEKQVGSKGTASEGDGPDLSGRAGSRPTRAELEALLRQHGGQVAVVARLLQRRRELIWRWCQSLGIDPRSFRDANASPERPES